MLSGHASKAMSRRSICRGGSSKPAVTSVVVPGRERRREELRRDQVDVAVDHAGGGDEPVAHDRVGVRSDRQVDPVADVRVAGPADTDDPAVLDPDVGLDHPDRRVDDEDPGDHHVELRGPDAGRLGHPGAQVLGVAPDRLVAGVVEVAFDPEPEIRVAEPDAVPRGGPVAGVVGVAREPGHDPPPGAPPEPSRPAVADEGDLADLARRPADRIAGRRRRAGSRPRPRGRTGVAG